MMRRLSPITSRLPWLHSHSLPMRLAYLFVFALSIGLFVSDRIPHHARIASALVTAVLWVAYGLLMERDENAREKLERKLAARDAIITALRGTLAERDRYVEYLQAENQYTSSRLAEQFHELTEARRALWKQGGHLLLQGFKSSMHQGVTNDEQF